MQFTKMQGVGNDFVVVSEFDVDPVELPNLAVRACSRHFGIGADGLLVIGSKERDEFTFRMFNPDGSEDMCGNGLRCAVLWHARRRGLENGNFTALAKDGEHRCSLLSVDPKYRFADVAIELSAPMFSAIDVPLSPEFSLSTSGHLEIAVHDHRYSGVPVNTGSTHFVILVDKLPSDERFFADSPILENHAAFPERTSVMWTKRTGNATATIRIWERGAGETLGCGTGACASAVVLKTLGLVYAHKPVAIESNGGVLTFDWNGGNAPVRMTGPAVAVFEGDI